MNKRRLTWEDLATLMKVHFSERKVHHDVLCVTCALLDEITESWIEKSQALQKCLTLEQETDRSAIANANRNIYGEQFLCKHCGVMHVPACQGPKDFGTKW